MLPYQQQAGFLTFSSSSAAAFPRDKALSDRRADARPGRRLPFHSDEIVRDLHPLPFYPFLRGTAQKGTCCRIQFYGGKYNTKRGETQEGRTKRGHFYYKEKHSLKGIDIVLVFSYNCLW